MGLVLRKFLAAFGLADILVIGGGLTFVTGMVRQFGWPIALVVAGGLALLAGAGVAIHEGRRGARR